MRLVEVLLVEVAGPTEPGPRSIRPDRLDVVVRVRGGHNGEEGVSAAKVTFPPGLQSPWNSDLLARRMADATGPMLGVEVGIGDVEAGKKAEEIADGWKAAVVPDDVPSWQRSAVSCLGDALEMAMRDLLTRAQDPGSTPEVELPDGQTVTATSTELAGIVDGMGRCIWERTDPFPDPLGTASRLAVEYDAPGLATLGKNALDSYLLEREAHRLGLRTARVRGVDLQIEDADGLAIGFHCTTGPSTSRYVSKVCGDKQVSRALLGRAGVRVPRGRAFAAGDWSGTSSFAEQLGWPVVVKPADGKGGEGVTTNIRDENELRRALAGLAQHEDQRGRRVIVEEHVDGADYRFLVVGGEVVSVIRRTPGGVVGDGRSTVAELVLAKNLARLRNPHLRTRLLDLDDRARYLLRGLDMTAESIPPKGEHVQLTTAGNIARGGDSVEVLDETHPVLLEMAVRAVGAVPGLDHAGVDVLAADHRRPLDGQNAAVCELNALPAITLHHYPAAGPARNVARALMEYYVPRYDLVTGPEPEATVSVGMRIDVADPAGRYPVWLAELARELGLSGWVRGDGEHIDAEVTGSVDLVTALSLRSIFGPAGSRPELVETYPNDSNHIGEFRLDG